MEKFKGKRAPCKYCLCIRCKENRVHNVSQGHCSGCETCNGRVIDCPFGGYEEMD